MADKRFIRPAIILIIFILVELIGIAIASFVCGCASHRAYGAQTQQGYPCPGCGFSIPMENISANIRTKNKCSNCEKIFFGAPMAKKTQEEEKRGEKVSSSGLKSHGPRSIYESDTNYQSLWIGGESFKETETGYSLLFWSFSDRKVKSRRVVPHWRTTRYHYP